MSVSSNFLLFYFLSFIMTFVNASVHNHANRPKNKWYIDKMSRDITSFGAKRNEIKQPETKCTLDKTSFETKRPQGQSLLGAKLPLDITCSRTEHP
jgi:hypothetical protein